MTLKQYFHVSDEHLAAQQLEDHYQFRRERDAHYQFHLHQHPFLKELTRRLVRSGVRGLQAADTEYQKNSIGENIFLSDGVTRKPTLYEEFFNECYAPNKDVVDPAFFPVRDLDFNSEGAYGAYNWELFFHVPMLIATHLSKNQRFSEAQRWLHYIFDPTDDSSDPTPERYWKVRPFQSIDVKKIEDILINLVESTDQKLLAETLASIDAWRDEPFRPHVVARYRQQAYMIKTVMLYLDNLVAWGDSLFRQDTGESIDEAMMLYVLAANILGPRPQAVPKKNKPKPMTYDQLRKNGGAEAFGFVLQEAESELAGDTVPAPPLDEEENAQIVTLSSLGRIPYFSVPRNEKLLGYWNTVADRLFKIRNSLNIQGNFRQLALFDPPIDPALLARAAAAGLDVGAIVNGLNQPLPLVRFQFLVQKAAEIAQEVKSLGNSLLSAMEKEDGEAMTCLRAKHERQVMAMVEQIKYGQWQEAIKSKEGLQQSLALAIQKYFYYEQQLEKKEADVQKSIPAVDQLDKSGLAAMKLKAQEPVLGVRKIDIDIASDLVGGVANIRTGGRVLSTHEANELILSEMAQYLQDRASEVDVAASILAAIPALGVHGTPQGVGSTAEFGGMHLHDIFSSMSSGLRGVAGRLSFEANNNAKIGNYARREQDWAFQSNLAAGEISQIFKQLRSAEIREAIAELELKNHRQQMKHAEEVEIFLNEEGTNRNGKKTNRALYAWMKREVKGLYTQSFQLAYDIAKKAERALQHEIGSNDLNYLQAGYLAGKEGLLAGERLYFDIKRMEIAYHELNQREYELTKHVSLQLLASEALNDLRQTGQCQFDLPESLFDHDAPGCYFRRIKTVSVSIPCVTGPYISVNCKLTLQKSSIRKSPTLIGSGNIYQRDEESDSRFDDYSGLKQSIVTSSAQNDSGQFETNLRDERYLPFENHGVISTWRLDMPADPSKGENCQFDYATISDVVMHIRYTARDGGDSLTMAVKKFLYS